MAKGVPDNVYMYMVLLLLLVFVILAIVLYPDNPAAQPAPAPETTGIPGPEVTVRLVETSTRYVDNYAPAVNRPVAVDVPVPVEERTEIVFQQPDDAIADVPRAVNMAMAANETYRVERQVERVFATVRLD